MGYKPNRAGDPPQPFLFSLHFHTLLLVLDSIFLYPVIDRPEGTRSIMDLSHRMVKNFWAMLKMSGKMDFSHWSELNNSGVRVSVRLSDGPGQPSGMVVSAASSLWLPLSCEALFNFFRDEKSRSQVSFQKQFFSSLCIDYICLSKMFLFCQSGMFSLLETQCMRLQISRVELIQEIAYRLSR